MVGLTQSCILMLSFLKILFHVCEAGFISIYYLVDFLLIKELNVLDLCFELGVLFYYFKFWLRSNVVELVKLLLLSVLKLYCLQFLSDLILLWSQYRNIFMQNLNLLKHLALLYFFLLNRLPKTFIWVLEQEYPLLKHHKLSLFIVNPVQKLFFSYCHHIAVDSLWKLTVWLKVRLILNQSWLVLLL